MVMRVLLCSPFNSEYTDNPGGIVVWTRNILEYYNNRSSEQKLELELYAMDRSIYIHTKSSLLSRCFAGVKDYAFHCWSLYKILRKKQYDIIHINSSASFSLLKDYLILSIARSRGIRSVVHFHFGRIPDLKKKNNWEWNLLKKVVRLSDKQVVMDERSYMALKTISDCVHNIPNPLSLQIEKYINDCSIKRGNNRQVLFVGHVVESKGIYDLIEACRGIDNIHLKVIGKVLDEDKDRIYSLVGKDGWLELIGTIPHSAVLQEMMEANVFVLPSYTEGFPNVIIESMYAACPIVATDVGAIPEMLDVTNGEYCGICIPVGDVSQLKAAIEFMLDNREAAEGRGMNARRRVVEQYSMEAVWTLLNKVWLK
jgi:glycosyltransferase involved in cell wall biosynthesis